MYQTLFLESLKDHFKSSPRALKKGDIIAVPLSEELARYGEVKPEDLEVDLQGSVPTACVYFVITSLELPTRSTVAKDPLADQLESSSFGCLVDPKVTKLVQTGIERALVPDTNPFLGICEWSSTLAPVLLNTDHLSKACLPLSTLKDGTPEKKLFDYVDTALQPGIEAFDLRLTVLLKGARGSGKKTLVASAARRTGFHLLDVSDMAISDWTVC